MSPSPPPPVSILVAEPLPRPLPPPIPPSADGLQRRPLLPSHRLPPSLPLWAAGGHRDLSFLSHAAEVTARRLQVP